MFIQVLKSKIHRVTVTEARLDYIGSITIDEDLLDAAGILPGERVYIVNNNNGARLDTYTIPGERGKGTVCLNGAAARLVQPGDIVIFKKGNSSKRATHVGLYIGNNQFIHASTAKVGVIISSMSSAYYTTGFVGGRRIVE